MTYYDFRDLAVGNTTTLPTNLFLRTSSDRGSSFGKETPVSGPFNYLVAPNAGGFFLGDYQGLVAAGGKFHPFFVQTTCNDYTCTSNRTDVFTGSF